MVSEASWKVRPDLYSEERPVVVGARRRGGVTESSPPGEEVCTLRKKRCMSVS